MRADRLISLIMLLQTRGRLTAHQLAQELEVSERTIYRDITALSTAGIPVYTEGGPGGGISLVESYRTDLTGLSPEQARALALLEIPEPLLRLGIGQELKAALLKLSAALPAAMRASQVQARQRIHLDAAWWFQPPESTPSLQTLQQAVWQDHLVRIQVQGDFGALSELIVAPYGLVAKASVWYLVYAFDQRLRARRVARILSAALLPENFERPAEFDLAAFWQKWCEDFEQERPRYEVRLLAAPVLASRLPRLLQENQPDLLNTPPTSQREGWQELRLTFESFESARTRLLGFGGAVEVLEPLALRYSMADYARQILARYQY